ncbi:hypothetical protein Fluta_3977 [Fluviicola taffensis DSM 16823]|uniref:Uncharacterized protein n=1 Tax=Fluviicola taffensis (strain DSM 16823 / NCIMB 13979 / RW262) TaxID=755732 RepID=F2IHY1_FLUTR|nr:hypothetical protein Fluta_3977 [Fluviicola taffensis DSM 16823]
MKLFSEKTSNERLTTLDRFKVLSLFFSILYFESVLSDKNFIHTSILLLFSKAKRMSTAHEDEA